MGYIFLGFVGLLVSVSVNGMITIGGYDWKAVNPNVQGISMALIAVGVIRILREMQRAGGGDGSWQRRYERARSGADKMMRRLLPAHKVREVRMLAVAAAVCLGIAFMLGILSRADLSTGLDLVDEDAGISRIARAEDHCLPVRQKMRPVYQHRVGGQQ